MTKSSSVSLLAVRIVLSGPVSKDPFLNHNAGEVSERALREIYLKPFQIAIKESNPWALMTSYVLAIDALKQLHAVRTTDTIESTGCMHPKIRGCCRMCFERYERFFYLGRGVLSHDWLRNGALKAQS